MLHSVYINTCVWTGVILPPQFPLRSSHPVMLMLLLTVCTDLFMMTGVTLVLLLSHFFIHTLKSSSPADQGPPAVPGAEPLPPLRPLQPGSLSLFRLLSPGQCGAQLLPAAGSPGHRPSAVLAACRPQCGLLGDCSAQPLCLCQDPYYLHPHISTRTHALMRHPPSTNVPNARGTCRQRWGGTPEVVV